MPAAVALLRAVNLGGRNRLEMAALRKVCSDAGLRDPATYIQSGNVVFDMDGADAPALEARLTAAIERELGVRADVIVRTAADLRALAAANPFADRSDVEPNKLLVVFFASDPGEGARAKLRAMKTEGEELRPVGRELFIHYPNGAGRSKLKLDKACAVPGTARNWNTVLKLLEMVEARGG